MNAEREERREIRVRVLVVTARKGEKVCEEVEDSLSEPACDGGKEDIEEDIFLGWMRMTSPVTGLGK